MDCFIGSICAFGFNFAPQGWANCNGAIISIQSNAALFALLGTYYGGNGTSTFGIPNLIGKVAINQGSGAGLTPRLMGETAGTNTVTLTTLMLPAHTHNINVAINANNAAGNSNIPTACFPASNTLNPYASSVTPSSFLAGVSGSITLGSTGSSVPINFENPNLTMNYCIATQGVFPSRN